MEVEICIDPGNDISVVIREYPDITCDEPNRYFVGRPSDEDKPDDEWLSHDEAVACCGFVEGAIPGASVLIEGNGQWAQGMISRKDFSGLKVSKREKSRYKKTSDLFWKHFKRGKRARTSKPIDSPAIQP